MTLSRRLTAEFLGTAFLLAVVIGSGIMGERLAGGNVAIALLGNTLATGAGLVALILTFGPISGAHFNPAVTLSDLSFGQIHWQRAGTPALACQAHKSGEAGLPSASAVLSFVVVITTMNNNAHPE